MKKISFILLSLFILGSCTKPDEPDINTGDDVVDGYVVYNSGEATINQMIQEIKNVENQSDLLVKVISDILVNYGSSLDFSQRNNYYDYQYASHGPNGEPMNYSARLYIPSSAFEGKPVKGVMLISHHFVINNNLSPTSSHTFEALATNFGYIVILPDGYGFGKNNGNFPIIYDAVFNGSVYTDGLIAGMQLLDKLEISYSKNGIINWGYSLGGVDALGVLKYTAQHPETNIKFSKTFAGGALTDVPLSLQKYLTEDWPSAKSYIIITIASILEHNPEIDPKDVFKEPLLSTYKDLISSKGHRIDYIKNYMSDMTLDSMLTDEMMNLSSSINKQIQSILKNKKIAGGWSLPSGSKLFLFHCIDDDKIPYENFLALKDYLELKSNTEDLSFYSGYFLSHLIGMAAFITYTAQNID